MSLKILLPYCRGKAPFYALLSITQCWHEFTAGTSVVVMDQGTDDPSEQYELICSAAIRRGVALTIVRHPAPLGIWQMRKALYTHVGDAEWVLQLDSDMLVNTFLPALAQSKQAPEHVLGYSGCKHESFAARTYQNDIHVLGSGGAERGGIHKTYFADAAICLLRAEYLRGMHEEFLRVPVGVGHITGEDVFVSGIMLAKAAKKDLFDAHFLALGDWHGLHLSPNKFSWSWETPTDVLIWRKLSKHLPDAILSKIYPHLAPHGGEVVKT